jgi:hypothetical protein
VTAIVVMKTAAAKIRMGYLLGRLARSRSSSLRRRWITRRLSLAARHLNSAIIMAMRSYHGGSGKARACPAALTTGRSVSRAAFCLRRSFGGLLHSAAVDGKVPERNAAWWIEHFTTAMGCDSEYGAGLRKIMGAWESSADRRRSKSTELPAGIPPFRDIHLANSGDDQSQFQ